MRVIRLDSTSEQEVIEHVVCALRDGGMIVYPTETVYGLGVDATNQEAVDKLLTFKGQRGKKPILIAVADQAMAEKYVDLNAVARRLYRTFLPGPVAVVSRAKRGKVSQVTQVTHVAQEKKISFSNARVTCGTRDTRGTYLAAGIASIEGTVGVRIPDYPLVLEIIKVFGKPITSTSANVSGARNPWSINDIKETTPEKKLAMIDLILDAGTLSKRPPSTVVDTSREKTEIVRKGMIDIGSWIVDPKSKTKIQMSRSAVETQKIGEKLIRQLSYHPLSIIHYPLLIALQGPLGAGKTVFTKGVARALGITVPIRSPSYTLVREYVLSGKRLAVSGKLFHIDAWRLHSPEEFQDLGLDRMLKPGNIIVVEWIERLAPTLKQLHQKAKVVLIEIEVLSGNSRRLCIYE